MVRSITGSASSPLISSYVRQAAYCTTLIPKRQQSACLGKLICTHRSLVTTTKTTDRDDSRLHWSGSRRFFTQWRISPNPRMGRSEIRQHLGIQNKLYAVNLSKNLSSSSNKRDFYDVLDVPKGADKGTIKKAYFKLAKQHHPDQNKDDKKAAEKFKEATEAYEVLSDKKQRELYDNFGHAGVDPNNDFSQGGGNPFGGGFPFGEGSYHFSSSGGQGGSEIDAEELFEAFFGGGGRRQRGPRRGADLQMHVRISFKEAVFGATKDLNLRYQVQDNTTGNIETKSREVSVDIPAGIENGMNLRLAGQGAEGDPGASKGNLLVQVIVDEDEYFQRDGSDIHADIPISLTQAVLGGTVDVRTLYGEVEVKIPKGCQVNTKLLLRGKGIQSLTGRGLQRKGNQIVHLNIEIPKNISSRQEQLLRDFDLETEKRGAGISGRLAAAAGSAFDTIFGGKKKEDSNEKKEESEKTQEQKGEADDFVDEKDKERVNKA